MFFAIFLKFLLASDQAITDQNHGLADKKEIDTPTTTTNASIPDAAYDGGCYLNKEQVFLLKFVLSEAEFNLNHFLRHSNSRIDLFISSLNGMNDLKVNMPGVFKDVEKKHIPTRRKIDFF
ncbi:hypothetical protein EDEG_01977 [Edhazardia aedis USNM 41457]|uniref:Uncharacterized protein n=1 Tax=Edhazardia aedis (strain USNM 41457) TaxID=1003232 RepID=J9D8A2_EDHAE|nr:hypothetical protein EDEG_01977 [Edhazardia aedis USNM 41457]|eukprot:EJW03739.1 hypothetical protein EDEG_01977 [Edhazardia aedis USNM 41457]